MCVLKVLFCIYILVERGADCSWHCGRIGYIPEFSPFLHWEKNKKLALTKYFIFLNYHVLKFLIHFYIIFSVLLQVHNKEYFHEYL